MRNTDHSKHPDYLDHPEHLYSNLSRGVRQYSEQESKGGGQFTMQEYRRSGQNTLIAGVQEWGSTYRLQDYRSGQYTQIMQEYMSEAVQ